ncbi:Glyoxylase, beta-lactamase superfamily II [Bacillus sp. 491mf]|uniref:MBL fold metallo-hydrolase n=1 Tax=Bacillus sp. 491mf TaxID=1761755 RepID=UPI0008E1FBC4|nr:MBL fold metallo-hydrolase [Bacillus sp. 491mf]SFC46658.1 Glyoxylase, beta-lactamase superfamily II [Bacillus sp. 491mf]
MNEEFDSKHFRLEKIRNGIYAAIAKEGSGAAANAGFIDLGDTTIVFDTFNTQQASEDLKYAAEAITNQPVTWVINSHWHGDHIRGNQTFKDSTIISSEMTYDKMKTTHPSRITKQKNDIHGLRNYIQSLQNQVTQTYDMNLEHQINFLSELEISLPTLELVLPQQTFKDEVMFLGTKRSAKLFTLGGGHSLCDAMLYIPEDKVIFMGDLLFVDCHPTFFEESNPQNWIRILKEVERMDIDIAIPGHGSVGTKLNFLQIIDYIHNLTVTAQKHNEIETIPLPNDYKNWPSPQIYHQNVKTLKELLHC